VYWFTYDGNGDLFDADEFPPSEVDMIVATLGTGKCSVEAGNEDGPIILAHIDYVPGRSLVLREYETFRRCKNA